MGSASSPSYLPATNPSLSGTRRGTCARRGCICGRIQTRRSTLPSGPLLRPRAPGLPVSTVAACCRWAPLLPQAYALALHWDVLTAEAKTHGKTTDRSKWRLVGLCHIAETKEQAYRDVEYGIEHWFRYFQQVAAVPQMAVAGNSVGEMIEFINASGLGPIGTADARRAQIERRG